MFTRLNARTGRLSNRTTGYYSERMGEETLRARVGAAIRQHRTGQQLTVSELARRSGVSKGTISQLENSAATPSIETLWAISDALAVPFSALVEQPAPAVTFIEGSDAAAIAAAQSDYTAALLSASPPGARRDLYLIRAGGGAIRFSEPHQTGTVEHVVLVSGRADVGPSDAPVDMSPGDYLSYRGDAPHIFRAHGDTIAILISELR